MKRIDFSYILLDNQELLEMAQVLQSNTSLTILNIGTGSVMRKYTFEALTKFIEIVTSPESKSRLEVLVIGDHNENKAMDSLSYKLTQIAASHGHKLVVQPVFSQTEFSKLVSLAREQHLKADGIPDSLLYGKK